MSLPLFSEVTTIERWQDYVSELGKVSAQDFKFVLLTPDELELLRQPPEGILLKMQTQDPVSLEQLVLMEVEARAGAGRSGIDVDSGWWFFFNPEAPEGGTRALHFWVRHASSDLERELVPDLIQLVRNAQILGITARRLRSRLGGKR